MISCRAHLVVVRHQRAQIQKLIKPDMLRQFPTRRRKPFQMHREHEGCRIDGERFAGVDQLFTLFALVLVAALQAVDASECAEGLFDGVGVADVEREVEHGVESI